MTLTLIIGTYSQCNDMYEQMQLQEENPTNEQEGNTFSHHFA
jgi:hypothetical protein